MTSNYNTFSYPPPNYPPMMVASPQQPPLPLPVPVTIPPPAPPLPAPMSTMPPPPLPQEPWSWTEANYQYHKSQNSFSFDCMVPPPYVPSPNQVSPVKSDGNVLYSSQNTRSDRQEGFYVGNSSNDRQNYNLQNQHQHPNRYSDRENGNGLDNLSYRENYREGQSFRENSFRENQNFRNNFNYRENNFRRSGNFRGNNYGENSYSNQGQSNWQQRNSNKRPWQQTDSSDDSELKHKSKKKKKPLSRVPIKKAWTEDQALVAINTEKECNKFSKNNSLIIKFPDPDLNREIVSKFHPAIQSVHFQQPSTPRFCFVTLGPGKNPEDMIEFLNKIKFGEGFLKAEHKKDREDDQNVGPNDIDPLTLYVGNLAQEITKEVMVNMYPKNRRIDIGFAKKMKHTRYAFVNFRNVDDSVEAFKATHHKQMYSKSLIVRFRRLHGTIGMPGETKATGSSIPGETSTLDTLNVSTESVSTEKEEIILTKIDTHIDITEDSDEIDLTKVKCEPKDDTELEDRKNIKTELDYKPVSLNTVEETPLLRVRPMSLKTEFKKEEDGFYPGEKDYPLRIKDEICEGESSGDNSDCSEFEEDDEPETNFEDILKNIRGSR